MVFGVMSLVLASLWTLIVLCCVADDIRLSQLELKYALPNLVVGIVWLLTAWLLIVKS